VGVLAGYGLRIEAAETATFIIAANLLLSRAGSWIERLRPEPGMAQRFYVIDLTCAARDEATAHTQLLQAVSARGLRLQGLESHTVEGSPRVEVEATICTARQEEALVERLVGELSLLPHIHVTGWTSTAPRSEAVSDGSPSDRILPPLRNPPGWIFRRGLRPIPAPPQG
jgi:putative Mg2+ transporter-C (MgtC) family protein